MDQRSIVRSGSKPPVAVFDNYWATTLAFARSLGRQGVPLHFYGSGAGRWSRYCTRRFSCPPVEDSGRFLPWLSERIRGGDITRVAPTTDLIAFYASSLRDEFSPEVQRTIAPLAEIESCLIKTRFAALCSIAGQPTLATAAPDDLDGAVATASEWGYPVILKPKSHLVVGSAERGRLVKDVAELRRYYHRYKVHPGQEGLAAIYPELCWPLIQQYLPAARQRVYSVSGVKDADGGVLAAGVSYKREQWPPDVGVSTVQIACDDERILEAGLQVVNRLLSCGIFELELVTDRDRLYAIDLNPRAFGFIALDIARGADLPWLWFRSTMGDTQPWVRQPPRVALAARDGLIHFVKRLAGLRARNDGGSREELRKSSLPRATISMLGYWSDPLPMLISHLYQLRHPRNLVRAAGELEASEAGDAPPR
jgi:D-aspartate ligase